MSLTALTSRNALEEVLASAAVESVLQPIVDLDTGRVVAYEALARGPRGTELERPDVLFAVAREQGRLAELDQICRRAALDAALRYGVVAPLTLFVNVEPEVLDSAPVEELLALSADAPDGLNVVMEITERALAARPADLLATVERVRSVGWRIALDDVGADDLSLAFMPLLRPDVVKLDLRLVQQRPGAKVAEIMNAVNAYAEQSGAVVLAEGIETDDHLTVARALGARLGQGWLFGRPERGLAPLPAGTLSLPAADAIAEHSAGSPFACLPQSTVLRRSSKALLVEVSKHLEREALRHGRTALAAATFQHVRHFTDRTSRRYAELAAQIGFVAAMGAEFPVEPVPGVRGAVLGDADPLRQEWNMVVLAPHFAAALLARDLGGGGAEADREFEFALTYDREVVAAAAANLFGRVAARTAGASA